MAKATLGSGPRYGRMIRGLGQHLKGLGLVARLSGHRGPDMRLNDGWSAEADERARLEYGDNGDCWWPGAAPG